MNKSEAYEVFVKSFKIVENLLEAGLLKKTIETSPDNDSIVYTHLHRQTILIQEILQEYLQDQYIRIMT